MTFDELLEALSGAALTALKGFDRERAIAAGISPRQAANLSKVHQAYWGPTRTPKQQRLAREEALAGGFTVEQLVFVEKRIAHIEPFGERMRLRRALLSSHCTYEALRRRADRLIPRPKPPKPKPQVRFHTPREEMGGLTLIAPARRMADLEHALRSLIDPSKPAAEQMVEPLLDLLSGEGSGVPPAAPRPLVVIPLPSFIRILEGSGDETVLGLTDGTTMTGAEYLSKYHGAELEVAMFHPQEGAVNLYRTERFANQKQRDLAKAIMPVCPVPGCRHGADNCEIHHIKAWKHGGETNIANLVPLCRYHNGTNDDDPGVVRHGRIDKVGAQPIWRSPNGYAVPNKHSKWGALNVLFRPRGAPSRYG
ncbi:HNH endonuclease signature motif containing protein [Corynebacterium meitnerae]|uniref:HNH endonuclease n=1 Tax=Corynebacterium meitnerae TaxID=2913498 RepID=A0A9X3LTZ1_9CORY|nr:HNH endonuclease signature motif containing protein [Corynebacterium meitnerae]MCZ9294207.1 HNH endonuclease [Corynebacterium meitnerae]